MRRKLLLILMSIVLSFGLTVLAGYLLSTHSNGRSDISLSSVVRFIMNPAIVVLTGAVVGRLSRNNPVAVAILGLLPWTVVVLFSPQMPPSSPSGWVYWISSLVIHLSLATGVALFV